MSGPVRFENLDCPVEAGEECVRPQRRAWGIDRSINPIYVTALISIIIAMLVWAGGPGGVNAHFSTLDASAVQQDKDIQAAKSEVKELKTDTKGDLERINAKLDRLIERRP